jgi:RHS repeat-associated protein
VVTVAYDGRARLTSYSVGTASQTMLYNGADERIRVVTTPASGPTDTRQFVYDLDHRIVGEYGAGGASDLKAEYIWLLPEVGASGPTGGDDGTGGYMPLAVAVGVAGQSGITSEVQWVHASHLGTPILTTNASGQAVTPYGYAAIGFPGQFANALLLPGAEHYYNRYRDYDPTTGRYIQADPIGLAGDENAWVYAGANPLVRVDPFGLEQGWLEWIWDGAVDLVAGEWIQLYDDPSLSNFGIAVIGCVPVIKVLKKGKKIIVWGISPKPGTRLIPKGIPKGWRIRPTKGKGGVEYYNPRNPNESVRIMQGNPQSEYPSSQRPYARQRDASGTHLRADGSRSPVPGGKEADAHIPLDKFKVR